MSSDSDDENKSPPAIHMIGAMSLTKFAKTYSISRSHLYFLLRTGRGPVTMKIGGRHLISFMAADEWRRRMENEQGHFPANDNNRGDK